MSVVSRKIRSTPVRSSGTTWDYMVALLAPDPTSDSHQELMAVKGVASSLISSESMTHAAVVCSGNGPRVRMYCLHGEDAITGEDAKEDALPHCPTEDGDWEVSLPSPERDLDWVRTALAKHSSRITARDKSERLGPTGSDDNKSSLSTAINTEAFLRS